LPRPRPGLKRLSPPEAAALNGRTPAQTWQPDLRSMLAQRFETAPLPPGWQIPQVWPRWQASERYSTVVAINAGI
jgi:hypothetical protein